MSEYYDEIIFQDPSVFLYKQLTSTRFFANKKNETDWKGKEAKTLAAMRQAKKRVSEEIAQMNERLKKQKNAIQKIKDEVAKIEKQPAKT